jgi:transglutaminase-like putative cysteine protease
LGPTAWKLFGHLPADAGRVRAVVDYVHGHLTFGYAHARPTRTAADALEEKVGVCRDFAHTTIALLRALNVPARYVNGYLGDIGVPKDPAPMDFSAWVEAFVGGRWYTLDARHNAPRIGRIVVARGRDAADVPLIHSFGPHTLREFTVVTEECGPPGSASAPQRQAA